MSKIFHFMAIMIVRNQVSGEISLKPRISANIYIGCPIYEQFTFILWEVYGILWREAEKIQFMDGDSHFISFPKLVSRTGKLLLLTNWPIESRTAVYNEVSLNVSDQRVLFWPNFMTITSYLLSIYLCFRFLPSQERHKDRPNKLLVSLICVKFIVILLIQK